MSKDPTEKSYKGKTENATNKIHREIRNNTS